MMTKEMMIKRALYRYDDRIKAINTEYNLRFHNLPVNSFGETSAESLLELNAWSIQKENEAKQEFVKALMEVSK